VALSLVVGHLKDKILYSFGVGSDVDSAELVNHVVVCEFLCLELLRVNPVGLETRVIILFIYFDITSEVRRPYGCGWLCDNKR